MPSALIVCLGNICRSPMGEAVLAHLAKKRGLDLKVDSAGTAGYHTGEEPDERTVEACRKHSIPISHLARKVSSEDFYNFTHILVVDAMNLTTLERKRPGDATAVLRLWGSYDDGKSIYDPYYGGIDGFENCYRQCERYSNAFLDKLVGRSD